jgi:hypothetical protein
LTCAHLPVRPLSLSQQSARYSAKGLVIFLIGSLGCATFRVDKISLGSRRIGAGSGAGLEREFR